MHLQHHIYRDVGLPLGIGQWLVDLQKMRLHWPRGISSDSVPTTYAWASFDEVVDRHFSESRGRFMAFIEDLVRNPDQDRTLSIQARNLDGQMTPLRLSARSVREHGEAYIYGIIHATRHSLELEDQAHSLSLILDATFYAADSGMIVFDDQLCVRRANRKAIAVLGITALDRPQAEIFADVAKRSPPEIMARLADALRQRATVGGTYHPPGTDEIFRWRATPWGRAELGARGVVSVFTRVEAHDPAIVSAAARHAVLQHVHTPVMVLEPVTGEISFANQAARAAFHLQQHGKLYVRNLVELCGRAVPAEAYDEVRHGAQFVNLRLGARIAKLDGPPEELLIEYAQ